VREEARMSKKGFRAERENREEEQRKMKRERQKIWGLGYERVARGICAKSLDAPYVSSTVALLMPLVFSPMVYSSPLARETHAKSLEKLLLDCFGGMTW